MRSVQRQPSPARSVDWAHVRPVDAPCILADPVRGVHSLFGPMKERIRSLRAPGMGPDAQSGKTAGIEIAVPDLSRNRPNRRRIFRLGTNPTSKAAGEQALTSDRDTVRLREMFPNPRAGGIAFFRTRTACNGRETTPINTHEGISICNFLFGLRYGYSVRSIENLGSC